jgi:HEAT repeat protein
MISHAIAIALSLLAGQDAATAPQGAVTAASGPAAADARLRQTVEDYLGVIDRPIPAEAWQKLGPDAVPVLDEIVHSSQADWRRSNALAALSILGGPRAEAVLLEQARDPAARWSVRLAAVRGAGHLLDPSRVTGELGPILERDPDVRVRAGTAEVLARRAGPAGCAAVRSQVAREPARRGVYHGALRACGD